MPLRRLLSHHLLQVIQYSVQYSPDTNSINFLMSANHSRHCPVEIVPGIFIWVAFV